MRYIVVDYKTCITMKILGFLFFPISFPFLYIFMFEYDQYVNMRNLTRCLEETYDKLTWLKFGSLSSPAYETNFGEGVIYRWHSGKVSWHDKDKNVIIDFSPDFLSKRLKNKLRMLIDESIDLAEKNDRIETMETRVVGMYLDTLRN